MKTKSTELTTDQKLELLQNSPEMRMAVKLLIAAFKEANLNSFIRFIYGADAGDGKEDKYEITFLRIDHEKSYNPLEKEVCPSCGKKEADGICKCSWHMEEFNK